MKKFSKMTSEQFVEAIKAEETRRDKEGHKSKGSGIKPSKKRLKRRNR